MGMEPLSIYGAALSTLLLVYELYRHFILEIPRLEVDVDTMILPHWGWNSPKTATGLGITARNVGRRPITVSSCGIFLDNTMVLYLTPQPVSTFPKKVEEGESCVVFKEMESIREGLLDGGAKVKYVFFRDATGRTYVNKSKQAVKLLNDIRDGKIKWKNRE